jgi:NADH-quinone oxidoreductase subunit L
MLTYVLIPLLPFAAFIIVGLLGRWLKEQSHWVAVPAVLLSFLLSVKTFLEVLQSGPIDLTLYTWITSGSLLVQIGFHIDQLTAVMLLLVTIVSGLVHIYTIGYMHGDRGYARFFAYVALFTFSMLMLVMSDNLLMLYVFWEAVGLCSYLLIAHWYERKSACDAATKAFIVNRVGDFGFGLGVIAVFAVFGTLNYTQVFLQAESHVGHTINLLGFMGGEWNVELITLIALLLFAGAVGKSAQIPLHVWLPDAMEGPTPISALIHAATMVTAGIFMVARLSPLFNLSPVAMDVVALVGGTTAIFAATIALTQNDIKRIVAYSTVSQLGYMMMACGLGAYVAGIFHLLTHGAFKALLFLCCGSVIHALAGEQDLRRMGGLKGHLPITYWTFYIGALALAGIPPFAGFFSKDEILWKTFMAGTAGRLLWIIGLITAFMTAFYIFRLIFSVFHGPTRVEPKAASHLHESPAVMTVPLLILAGLSAVVGFAGIPVHGLNFIEHFLSPVLAGPGVHAEGAEGGELFVLLMVLSVLAGLLGWGTAYYFYVMQPGLPSRLAVRLQGLYQLSFNKWYVDELYDRIFVRPTVDLARWLWDILDVRVIDRAVNGVGWVTEAWARGLRLMQSGQLQHYALVMVLGAFVIISMYLLM